MLAELRRRAPEADALEGTAEAIPLPDGSADAVFVAEAFHWFRTEPAAREIGRVLRPGGGLVLLWNRPHWDPAELPWLEAFGELLDPVRHDAGRFPAERDEWPDALAATGLFTPIERSGHEHVQRLPAEDLSTLVSSWSWIANLPDDRRAELLAQVDRLVAGERELPLRHRTEVCVAHLRD
jgi:SAM-dependent methyltransferase